MPGTDIELARALFPKAKDVVAAGLGSSVTVRTERGRAVSDSSEGLVEVVLDTVAVGDDATIECPTSCSISEGDEVLVYISGTTPVDVVVAGEGDRQDERIHAIEADYVKASTLEADVADIGFLKADSATITDLQADAAKVHDLTADQLSAATAYIATLTANSVTAASLTADVAKVHDLTAQQLSAAAAYIAQLSADSVTAQRIAAISGDFDTVRANAAKVANLTAAELEADHATIGSLDANYAKITNGHIDSALIDTAAIVDEQVFTVTGNKATLAQIDASKINVLNLKAKDIEVERINGQPVTNKTLVDALSQHETDISGLDTKIDNEVEALNDRIDGAIETFTGTAVPTLSNAPASSWNTTTLKDQHVGDVYYVVNSQSAQNGYCYRFTKSGSTYSWQLIKDSDVTAALSRLQTAEGKIGDIEQFDVTVGSFMTDTDEELSSLKTKTTNLETSLGDKVDTSTFNTVSQKVDTNEANITSMSTVLTNNGLTSSTNITNTVNTVKQTADTNTSNISSLQTTVSGHTTTIQQHTTSISQNTDAIALRATKTDVQQVRPAYATSTTGAGTAAKVATIDPAVTGYALYKGASVSVAFSTANTAATPTLNLNSTGAKQIRSYTGAALSEAEYKWAAGATIDLVYDGTYWRMQDGGSVKRVTAAEASIRVNAENIESKVSKDGVISSINQSAETVKIQASKVEIDGTAVFSAISSDVDDAITSKGYQTSSQVNSAITSKGYATTTQAQSYATTAKSEAISAAASDATTKANAAEANAKAYTDALEIGGRNLVVASKLSNGYLAGSGSIGGMNATRKEGYSDYIPVSSGESLVFQAWVTVTDSSTEFLWMAYEFYNSSKTYIGSRPTKYHGTVLADGRTYNLFDGITVPDGAAYIRVSMRRYDNGVMKLERGNKATDWTPAPEDIEANAVKRTQRIWYRKSASGAPATPGTASSNWVTKADDGNDAWTKMHIAISSTHKYIYTCEQYEMANGTVGYTSVLLDNTITVIDGGNIITGSVKANTLDAADINASKSLTVGAMTDAAASTILNSNVQVGGKNLALDSKLVSHDAVASAPYAGMYSTAPKVERSDGFVAIAPKQGGNWTGLVVYMDSLGLAVGDLVVFSCLYEYQGCNANLHFYAMSLNSSGTRIYPTFELRGSNGYNGNYHSVTQLATINSSNPSGKVWVVAEWSQAAQDTIDAGGHVRFTFQVNGTTEVTSGGSVHLYATKLERGNKATDWTPAPEDTQESIDTSVGEVNASLVATEDSLSQQIQDTNDGLSSVSATVTQLNTIVQQDRADMGRWLNFNESEGLTIGKAGSAFKVVTDETRQAFMYGNETLAYTSGDRFVAPRMEADELHIGNWMWVKRDNGNLSLKWIG